MHAATWWLVLMLAGIVQAATGDAPEVSGVRINPPPGPIRIGTPFEVVLEIRAPSGGRWLLPNVPQRLGPFTLLEIRVSPPAPGGSVRLLARLQAFQTGPSPLPRMPIRWQPRDGPARPLDYAPGTVEVAPLLRGTGPFAFQPPRGGLAPPVSSPWPWITGGLALAGAAAAAVVWLRRRKRRGVTAHTATPRTVDLGYFLAQLEQALERRSPAGTLQAQAGRIVEVFRDYLSWRFRGDFQPLTTREIRMALETAGGVPDPIILAIDQTLGAVDELRFGPPAGGRLPALAETLRGAMLELGSRDKETANAAGAANS